MAMRSASRIASSKSWVMKTMVFLQHALQAQELVLHLAPDQGIERRERFVQKPDFRLDRERAGDADALLLAAGQLARIIALASLQADQLDHLERLGLARAPRDALDLQRKGDIAEHRQMGQQREVLEHHAHAMAPELDQLLFAACRAGCGPRT